MSSAWADHHRICRSRRQFRTKPPRAGVPQVSSAAADQTRDTSMRITVLISKSQRTRTFNSNPPKGTRTMKKLFACAALLFAASAFAAGAPSLTGDWTIHNSIAGNDSDQACKFVQAENKI